MSPLRIRAGPIVLLTFSKITLKLSHSAEVMVNLNLTFQTTIHLTQIFIRSIFLWTDIGIHKLVDYHAGPKKSLLQFDW